MAGDIACFRGKGLLMGDVSGHTVDTASRVTCRRIVRALAEKYDWALLSEDELVELVLGSIELGVSPTEVKRKVPLKKTGRSSSGRDRAEARTHLGHQVRCQVLLDALKRLPNDLEQQAILLKFIEGLSDAETGERLGITANHARVLRHRGIRRLRQDKRLTDYFERTNGEEED